MNGLDRRIGTINWGELDGTSAWSAAHLEQLSPDIGLRAPRIVASDVSPLIEDFDLWDMWPLATSDGGTANVAGGRLWFVLSAPMQPDPVYRHGCARIRLLHQRGADWTDCGYALPDGLSPGSREWSGSAILDPGSGQVTLFFTVAGRRGEPVLTFEQRLFRTRGRLQVSGDVPMISNWSTPEEIIESDDGIYVRANQKDGEPGKIKAFRDPAYFRDPADGRDYLLFTASLKNSTHEANGAIGLARSLDQMLERWELLPPILHADGINNELERPHVIWRNGLYYLFWSTQRQVFASGGPWGPTGLYGMVAPALSGPYRPLNGSGLVIANPDSEPSQAYSWWVLGEGEVISFVDYWGLEGRRIADHPDLVRSQFGGVPAPVLRLSLEGDRTRLLL